MVYKLRITADFGTGYNQGYKLLDRKTQELGGFAILNVTDKVSDTGWSMLGFKNGYIERTITYTTIGEALGRYTKMRSYDSLYKSKKNKNDFLSMVKPSEKKNANLEGICDSLQDKWKKETNLVKDLVDLINYGKAHNKDGKYLPKNDKLY